MTAIPGFAFDGRAMTAQEFSAHVAAYNFGSIPPDFVVLHHTAVPGASWARMPGREKSDWDRGEAGMTEAQKVEQRRGRLAGLARYYRGLGWSTGPHLFVDDLRIYLMTPMYEIGTHAAQGNSYRDWRKQLHYSIGLEVIGYYESVRWPPAVERLVGHAVAVLHKRLGTFDLTFKRNAGGLSAHRDYNKPSCPGAAITPDYYVGVCRAAAAGLV